MARKAGSARLAGGQSSALGRPPKLQFVQLEGATAVNDAFDRMDASVWLSLYASTNTSRPARRSRKKRRGPRIRHGGRPQGIKSLPLKLRDSRVAGDRVTLDILRAGTTA
jgi:hypothetical protein